MDLPPEKKLEAEKRGMAMNDYNGEMRKGGRGPSGGVLYRPGSKEPAPADAASYYDKVRPHARRCVRTSFPLVTLLFFLPGRFSPSVFPLSAALIGWPVAVALTDLTFGQSGWLPWR